MLAQANYRRCEQEKLHSIEMQIVSDKSLLRFRHLHRYRSRQPTTKLLAGSTTPSKPKRSRNLHTSRGDYLFSPMNEEQIPASKSRNICALDCWTLTGSNNATGMMKRKSKKTTRDGHTSSAEAATRTTHPCQHSQKQGQRH